jgi:2-keto-4-pentenoate hydratase
MEQASHNETGREVPTGDARLGPFLASRSARPRRFSVPLANRPSTMIDGYRIQREIYNDLAARGQERLAGYKIGCISSASQKSFQVEEPIYAGIFDSTQFPTLRAALSETLTEPSIECEIAFRIDAPPQTDWLGEVADETLVAAIGEAFLACEIIDNRYGAVPTEIGAPTLLTDDFLHAGFVLGPSRTDITPGLLNSLRCRVEVDGEIWTEPPPSNLSPLSALRWLAQKLHRQEEELERGQIILTGSLLPPAAIHRKADISIEIEGFGRLSN